MELPTTEQSQIAQEPIRSGVQETPPALREPEPTFVPPSTVAVATPVPAADRSAYAANKIMELPRPDGSGMFPIELRPDGTTILNHAIMKCFGYASKKATKKASSILNGAEPALKAQVMLVDIQDGGVMKKMNVAPPEIVTEIVTRIHNSVKNRKVSPEHESLVHWLHAHRPRMEVTCPQCKDKYIVDLDAIKNKQGVNNNRVNYAFNHTISGGFVLDLALCDTVSKQVFAAVEVRKNSKVTNKKVKRLAADDIIWCEILIASVDCSKTKPNTPIPAANGSICSKCVDAKRTAEDMQEEDEEDEEEESEEEESEEEDEEFDDFKESDDEADLSLAQIVPSAPRANRSDSVQDQINEVDREAGKLIVLKWKKRALKRLKRE